MAGFWDDLGRGLQDAGSILSPTVYQSQEQERQLAIKQRMAIQEQNRALMANAIMSGAAPATAGAGLGLPAGLGPDVGTQIKIQQQQVDKQASEAVSPFLQQKDYQGALTALAKIPGGMRSSVATELMRVINSQIRAPQANRPFAVGGSVAIPDTNAPGGIRFETPPKDQQKPPKVSTFAQELIDAGIKPDSKEWVDAWKKRISRETSPTSTQISMGVANSVSDDTLKFIAQQYLTGDRTVVQGFGRSAQMMGKIRDAIAKEAKDQGMSPRDAAAAIAEFEGAKAGQRSLGTRQAQIEMASNVAKQFGPLAVKASEGWDRTSVKTINDLEKAVQSRTASPDLRRFAAANNALINAYARAVSPTGVPTVSDKDHAREILDVGFSKGDYKAAVDQLMIEIDAELKAPGAVKEGMREYITGEKSPGKPSEKPSATPALPPGFKPV